MDSKKIEDVLRDNYKSLETDEYSKRLARIHDRLNYPEQKQEILSAENKLVTAGVNQKGNSERSGHGSRTKLTLLIISVATLFLIVGIVIVWSVVSLTDNTYSIHIGDLYFKDATRKEFEDAKQDCGFEIIDLSNIETYIYLYATAVDENGTVYGEAFEFSDDNGGRQGRVEFYSSSVIDVSVVEEPFESYNTDSGFVINYQTHADGEDEPIYQTVASGLYRDLNYYIEYTSINNDVLQFFNELFI